MVGYKSGTVFDSAGDDSGSWGLLELHTLPAPASGSSEATWSAWKLGFSSWDCLPSVSYGVTPQGRAFLGRRVSQECSLV